MNCSRRLTCSGALRVNSVSLRDGAQEAWQGRAAGKQGISGRQEKAEQ